MSLLVCLRGGKLKLLLNQQRGTIKVIKQAGGATLGKHGSGSLILSRLSGCGCIEICVHGTFFHVISGIFSELVLPLRLSAFTPH